MTRPNLLLLLLLTAPARLCASQVNKQQLQAVKERFQAFLSGETRIVADEAFGNAVRSFYEARPSGSCWLCLVEIQRNPEGSPSNSAHTHAHSC